MNYPDSGSVLRCGRQESALLTSSQVQLVQLDHGPHFRQQGYKALTKWETQVSF